MRLPNLGQTCYANALIQCLLNSVCVCEFLDSFMVATKGVAADEKRMQSPLLQFVQLYRMKKGAKGRSDKTMSPDAFLQSSRKALPDFVLGRQHDAHELFVCLMSVFDECIMDINAKEGLDVPLFSSLFAGHSMTSCQCLICGETAKNTEDFNNFYISVRRRESLVSRLKKTMLPEYVTGEGKRWCKRCCAKQECKIVTEYDKLPSVALFQLQRFEVDQDGKITKLPGHVPFPSVLTIGDMTYELRSVCIHIGRQLTSGHFVALLRSSEKWILADDSRLSVLDSDRVEEMFADGPEDQSLTTAYLLFYDRMD